MKRAIVSVSFMLTVCLMAACNDNTKNKLSDSIPASEVPAAVTAAFNAKYPGVTDVKWEKEREKMNNQPVYQVEFEQNGKDREAKVDASGKFLSEESD